MNSTSLTAFVAAGLSLTLSVARADAPATRPALPRYNADPKRTVLPNGAFGKIDKGKPANWSGDDAFAAGLAAIDKNNGQILRLKAALDDERINVTQTVALKPDWKLLSVAARVRAFDLQPATQSADAGARVRFTLLDSDGKTLHQVDLRPLTEGGYRDWSKPTQSIARVENATQLRVEVALQDCSGQFEVDDVLVVPIDPAAELDADRIDRFQKAIADNDAATVRELVTADRRYVECRDLDFDGGTPLIQTAWINRPEMTTLLLELGADRDAEDRNWAAPALGWAAFWGRPKVTKILLDAGADVNSSNGAGATALVSAEFGLKQRTSGNATEAERREVIQLLIDRGGTREKQKK